MKTKPEPLWLAVQFPHLALDLVSRSDPRWRERSLAISDTDQRRPCIFDCNPPAARSGVRPGMPVNAALGLDGRLHLRSRDAHAECEALERLAAWCYQYSSHVCPQADRGALVLEAGASQRLFGSPEYLARELDAGLLRMGYHARAGSAPTPEAAYVAARHSLHVASGSEIQHKLGSLPLESLYLPAGQHDALAKTGFSTIAEVTRLPRKALARRMGPATVDYLDRLRGSRPDPMPAWAPPERFSARLELPAEMTRAAGLLFPLRRLVDELCGALRGSDRGVQALDIHLKFDRAAVQEQSLRLGLQRPSRNEAHIMLLLRERLERLALPAPVCEVALEADRCLPFDVRQEALFEDETVDAEQMLGPLLERLQARLGREAVQGLRGAEDHRPEYSWAVREPGEPAPCAAMPHRPVWLFTSPQQCRIDEYRILAGPERIEAGWWDGHDCRRDYFVVRDRRGSTLWAFREYKPKPGWYLQGMFA